MTKTCRMSGGAAIARGPTAARETVRVAIAAAERIDDGGMKGLLERAQLYEEEPNKNQAAC
jgi:hypothetical protein